MTPTSKKRKNIQIKGIAASAGIAIGVVYKLSGDVIKVEERDIPPEEVDREIKKFDRAIDLTRQELHEIQKQARDKIDKDASEIFDAHQMLLDDQVIIKETKLQIANQLKNADFVYHQLMKKYQDSLENADDEFFMGRVADIKDVKRRLIRNIQGKKPVSFKSLVKKSVIVARDLTPSETVMLDKNKVLAFATDKGGKNSHAAIMARSMEIPSVVGAQNISELVQTGDLVILDGNNGDIIINPSKRILDKYVYLRTEYDELTKSLSAFRNLPSRTLDGKDVELSANLDFADEIKSVINYGAQGVGLFRTEYIYLTRDQLPSEEEEFAEYCRITESIYPHPVIIRTLDIGGDKNPRYLSFPEEDNPALGSRGIRFSLDHRKILKSQLTAILRASAKGNVKILLPMISCHEEISHARALIDQVKGDLRSKKIPYDPNIEIGIMIETPSAALMADVLAEDVDFLSIGTNDLIQYTLAVDRGNIKVAHLYKRMPLAVLRLIRDVIIAGHRKGVWVGICGEMAADPLAILVLLGLDIDELSVSPPMLPEVKKIIRLVTFKDAEQIAEKALQMKTSDQIETYLKNVYRTRYRMKVI
ncbi:MAG: phosphoenolpyruvate--protein phosphotransferase [Calditrichaeota bacterium]|nr:phosphoenolpyruvate--protein phosphotransferase [Calditrichota bacterium]